MKKYLTIVIGCLIILCSETVCYSDEYYPSGIVTDKYVLFSIPIYHQNEYKWFENSHKDNSVEYECLIYLQGYHFGFTLFNMPLKNERSGNINKLLRNGQADIWKKDGNTVSRLDNDSVSVSYSVPIPFIKIKIEDPETIKLLFSSKPQESGFTVSGFEAPFDRDYITVEYK